MIPLGTEQVTIGRAPDSTLVIEDDLLVLIDAEGVVLMAKQKPEFRRFVTARLRGALAADRFVPHE